MSYIKRFLLLIIMLSLVNSSLFIYFYFNKKKDVIKSFHTQAQNELKEQIFYIQNNLKTTIYDLLFLSNITKKSLDFTHKNALINHFVDFSKEHKDYDQIRFIDKDGFELIRVDNENGIANVLDSDKLQNKENRYCFKKAINLKEREIYISKFDLNIENSSIEFPYKPMIRLSTPIYDTDNNLLGMLVINYKGSTLIKNLKLFSNNKLEWKFNLLNDDGYWIVGYKKKLEWAFMFDDKKDLTFYKFLPTAWEKIKQNENSYYYDDQNGLVSFKKANVDRLLEYNSIDEIKSYKLISDEKSWILAYQIDEIEIINLTLYEVLELFPLLFVFSFLLFILFYFYNIQSSRVNFFQSKIEKFKNIYEDKDGIVVLNREFNILYINQEFEKMTHYSKREILQNQISFEKLFRIDDENLKIIKDSLNKNESYKEKIWLEKKDAIKFITRFRIYKLQDNNTIYYIAIISDITELFLYKDLEFFNYKS